jgi:glutathione S-transferase
MADDASSSRMTSMPQDPSTYTQIGVELSLYSGKTRAYLRHKRIPFVERGSNPWEIFHTIPRRTHASAVPVVITPEGEWLQDTSEIIDELERRFPANPVLPGTPVLRFASYLFELWGDEFWLPLAMHARWSHEENLPLFLHDVGVGLAPGFPRWLQRAIGANHARLMRNHLPRLGITPGQIPLIDRFAQIQLDALDRHFAQHRFLFGDRPSLGDYGMIAPLYAHLGRDPWPKRELIDPRKHLAAWIRRMLEPDDQPGEFQAEDRVADTLTPALRSIFDEMIPFLAACGSELRRTPVVPTDASKAPRFLGEVSHPLAGGTYRRTGLSYPVWMAQRMLDAFRAMSAADQATIRGWLASVGGSAVLELDLPRVRRIGLAAARTA